MKKVVFLLTLLILVTGCSVVQVEELTDAERFSRDYNISEDNPFVYATYEDIENVLSNTGIIFFGNPDLEGSNKTVKYLYPVAVEENIDLIYYYNPIKLKERYPEKYKKIEKYFNKILTKDKKIPIPMVISIKNGKITGYSNYFSEENHLSEDKLTEKQKKAIKENYRKILKYKKCTDFYD